MNSTPFNARSTHLSFREARSQLRRFLGVLFVLLALAFAVLLHQVNTQLKDENVYRYRVTAHDLAERVNARLNQYLVPEEQRPFNEYSFFNILENTPLPLRGLQLSPLSEIPPRSPVPGVIGYFEIAPDGTFSSPVLPDIDLLSFAGLQKHEELEKRLALSDRLHKAVSNWALSPEVTVDQLPPSKVNENNERPPASEEAATNRFFPLYSFDKTADPLQAKFLRDGEICFFRKSWLFQPSSSAPGQRRYIQGFLVDPQAFLQDILQPVITQSQSDGLTNLFLVHDGGLLATIKPGGTWQRGNNNQNWWQLVDSAQILYKSHLEKPLDEVALVFSAAALPESNTLTFAKQLEIVLAALLALGLIGIYYLGVITLQVAQDRNNFVSAVSHELKTPLTSIRMLSESLSAGITTDENQKREYYDLILRECERLSRLIQNVLYFSAKHQEAPPLELNLSHPDALLEQVRALTDSQIKKSGFELRILNESVPSGIQVLVNTDAFTQIFVNLIDNALKFGEQSERKEIVMGYVVSTADRSSAPDKLVFFVRDYGRGISETHAARIFEPFFRGEDELTRRTKGTGIGLAIVKDLAERMGAQISVVSPGMGAEFRVSFPSHDQQAPGKTA